MHCCTKRMQIVLNWQNPHLFEQGSLKFTRAHHFFCVKSNLSTTTTEGRQKSGRYTQVVVVHRYFMHLFQLVGQLYSGRYRQVVFSTGLTV